MQRKLNMPFTNVVAGQKAHMTISAGETLFGILLQLSGTFVVSDITRLVVKLLLGGTEKTIRDLTGTELAAICVYDKGQTSTAYLPIWFTEKEARDLVSRYGAGVGTIGTSGVLVEVDIAAAAVNPALTSWRYVGAGSALDDSILGQMRRVETFTGADRHYMPLPAGANSAWMLERMFLFQSAQNIDKVELVADGITLWEGSEADVAFEQQEHGFTPAVATMFVVDPALSRHALAEEAGGRVMAREAIDLRKYNAAGLYITTSGTVTIKALGFGPVDVARL